MATYKESGVDIDAGEELIRRIKKPIRSTFNPNVLTDIGMFGAFYRADFKGIKKPVLVSSVDGVGTKLKIAIMMNRHNTNWSGFSEPLCERHSRMRGKTHVFFRLLCHR